MEDRAVPIEDGDLLQGYRAVHEENFLNSWLLDDVEDKAAERGKNREAKEDESISRKREVKQKWLLQKWRAPVEQRSCHGQLLE